ncbi:SRPBCC domain-containing protein [Bradyrhizobium ontarionense]|uniref:SRPBCC domain-containing protein n=1 Tax=Bradyrhizobium ontarionense TaxID=2898149 RepID=A0ABY3R5T2_9BRAD|nr:SRPBCC domain-containing protein [Bradyrhizobium sp. A19]UFZ02369.1 SRPBCC domain-containing protein [Bradyrhizobium sp. A19]
MTDTKADQQTKDLVLDYDLDAPPEKVWRAISIPALRENWLPRRELADAAPISATPGEEVRYRMRDDEPPFLESIVTFQLSPNAAGGTRLRIIHGLVATKLTQRSPPAANSNRRSLMRAA